MSTRLKQMLAIFLAMGVAFTACLYFGVDEKPFYRKAWFGLSTGAAIGASAGVAIAVIYGAVGVATAGIGFALTPALLTGLGAMFGFGTAGGLLQVFARPGNYDIHYIVVAICIGTGVLVSGWLWRLIGGPRYPQLNSSSTSTRAER